MTTSAVSDCQSSTKTHAKAVTACSSTLSSAVPALPPSTDASAVSILPSETQESSASNVNQTPEIKRAIKLLFNKTNRLTENYTMHDKIAYSGCQGAIEDAFWKTVEKDPTIFIIEDKIDEVKLKETYKSSARSLGVRFWKHLEIVCAN